MKVNQLLFFIILLYLHVFGQNLLNKRFLQTTSCPNVAFSESYSTVYGTYPFIITPVFNLNCGTGKSFSILSGSLTNSQAMNFDSTGKSLSISNWQQFLNNQYYNFYFQATVINTMSSEQLIIGDSFYLVVGQVPIQYVQATTKAYKYDEPITFDYLSAYDPQQPETGVISVSWSCDPLYQQCSSLGMSSTLDPINRIKTSKMAFNYDYKFAATLQNKNTKFLKSSTDQFTIKILRPEESSSPKSCIYFQLVFKNQKYPVNTINSNEVQVIFDNLNYTDIVITTPQVDISQCSSLSANQKSYLAFGSFNNPDLFTDPRSYPFNSSDIVISKSKIQASLSGNTVQTIYFYVYLIDNVANSILGFQYQKLSLKMNDQTLYAILTKSFIQVDRNKVIYIDGSTSFDYRGIDFKFIWGVEQFPNLVLPNQRILTLTPDQRTQMGINQAGKYYNYTLRVSDPTRISDIAKVLVQLTPEADPKGCMQVGLKDIDLDKIVTYTIWPLMLQAKVTKASCEGLVPESLIWETQSVDWQFWQNFGNEYTITMDRSDLQKLPKNKDIYMSVSQYYKVYDIEYVSKKTFVLFVEKTDLIPIVDYPRVINVLDQQLILDATKSYDPQAQETGTTDVPIKCSWKCPDYMLQVCQSAFYSSQNCYMNVPSNIILNHVNYTNLIKNQPNLFTLTISKDTRVNVAYVFVTIVESNWYPKCQIDFTQDMNINKFAFVLANCSSSQSNLFTYSWKAFQWSDTSLITTVNNNLIVTNNILRLPPYILSQYKEILIMLAVSNNTYTTPICIYKKVNDQSGFTRGVINKNFNQFTAYLSTFTMTPANWDSSVSSQLLYQYRMKFSNNIDQSYRVLLAPTTSASNNGISTNLPPFEFENSLYIDVIDGDNNYMTSKEAIISKSDIYMTAATFQSRVNSIISQMEFVFSEINFEQNMLKLMLTFMAYRNGQFDQQGQQKQFFKDLSQNTISYLYNTFVIDQRIQYVSTVDRRILIKQHVVEILNFIAMTNKNLTNVGDMFTLLNSMMVDDYYLAGMLPEITLKIYQIIFQTTETQYQTLSSTIIQKMVSKILNFTYSGELIQYSGTGGYTINLHEIGNSVNSLPSIDGIDYPKASVYQSKFIGGLLISIRNNTFVHMSIHDKAMSLQRIGSLNTLVSIDFYLTIDQILKNMTGTLTFSCSQKDDIANPWVKIPVTTFNAQNGIVTCKSNQIGEYTLFIVDLTDSDINNGGSNGTNGGSNNTNGGSNNTNGGNGEQNISGSWNDTLGPRNYLNPLDDYIFNQQTTLLTVIAIITLMFFLLSNYVFYCKYKDEHQIQEKSRYQFEIIPHNSLRSNRCRLYLQVLIHFNPYLNLFLVFNKFLHRWVRSSLLQIYFMSLSAIYALNQTLLSQHITPLGEDPTTLLGLFLIVVLLILFMRPWALKLMYKLLYEPDDKVENYDPADQGGQSQQLQQQTSIKDFHKSGGNSFNMADYNQEGETKAPLSLPKLFDDAQNVKSINLPRLENFDQDQNMGSMNTDFKENKYSDRDEKASDQQEPQQIQIGDKKRGKINKKKNKLLKSKGQKRKDVKLDRKISDQEESKMSEFSLRNSLISSEHQIVGQPQSIQRPYENNQNQILNDYSNQPVVFEPNNNFHLPPIMQPKKQLFQDINASGNQSQNQQMIQSNLLYEEDNNEDFVQMEGGEPEEAQDQELQRDEDLSLDEAKPTQHQSSSMLNNARNQQVQYTDMAKEDYRPSKLELNQESSFSSNSNTMHVQKLMPDGKTLFINKLIGKFILLMIWVGLAVLNMICIEHMIPQDFYNWLILSLVTFALIIFLIDPILYLILVCLMIRNKGQNIASYECNKVQYFTRAAKEKYCSELFVVSLIGREKMIDLQRAINPLV